MATKWATTSTGNYNNTIAGNYNGAISTGICNTTIGTTAGFGNIAGNSTITIAQGAMSLQGVLNSGSSTTLGNTNTINIQRTSYHVLGEDIEINGWSDINLVVIISTLNVLKKPFYDELLKNGYIFPKEIEAFLKIKFRDILIDEIFN